MYIRRGVRSPTKFRGTESADKLRDSQHPSSAELKSTRIRPILAFQPQPHKEIEEYFSGGTKQSQRNDQ